MKPQLPSQRAADWNTPLNIPLPWDECQKEVAPPDRFSFTALLDSMHRGYASYWLCKAQQVRDKLQDDPLFLEYLKEDRDSLEETWITLHNLADDYAKALFYSRKKEARKKAFDIQQASEAFDLQRRGSDSAVKRHIADMKRATRESAGMSVLLSKEVLAANMLVVGQDLADCNIGYREAALRAVTDWLNESYKGRAPEKRIFWLYGERGCGKSVLTHYLAKLCHGHGALAAGYRVPDAFNKSLWPDFTASFSSDLIDYIGPVYKANLIDRIEALTCTIHKFLSQPPPYQFEKLLTPAWKDLPKSKQKPMIMILDGLERCDEWSVRYICALIHGSISLEADLPVYWIVSSCETQCIRDHLITRGNLGNHVVAFELPLYDPPIDQPNATHAGMGELLKTPMQFGDTKTPTVNSFKSPKLEEVPLLSATGVLYGQDDAITDAERHGSEASSPSPSMASLTESEDE